METIIVVLLILLGAMLWTQVLATFCDLATNADPSKTEYRLLIDDVNRFCQQEALPQEMRRRLRQFFAQRRHVLKVRMLKAQTYVYTPMHMHLCTCTYAHALMHMHLCTCRLAP